MGQGRHTLRSINDPVFPLLLVAYSITCPQTQLCLVVPDVRITIQKIISLLLTLEAYVCEQWSCYMK